MSRSPDAESLQQQRVALEQERVVLNRVLRCAQQRRRREELHQRALGCTPGILDSAIAVLLVSHYDMDMAVAFAQTRCTSLAGRDPDDVKRLLEETFLTWSPDAISSFPASDRQLVLERQAVTFKAEADVVKWIGRQNSEQGVAPSSQDVWRQYQEYLGQISDEEDAMDAPPINQRRQVRRFAANLRRRWHLGFRTLPDRDETTTEQLLEKVGTSVCCVMFGKWSCFWLFFWSPIWAPIFELSSLSPSCSCFRGPNREPFWSSILAPNFVVCVVSFLASEAHTFWKWLGFIRQFAAPKEVLMLNLDETCIGRTTANVKGHVVTSRTPGQILHRELVARTPSRHRRGIVTHIAIIANRTDVQPALPQIFVGNPQRFSLGLTAQLQHEAPANVHIWRQKSSYNNIETMCKVIDLLAVALQPWMASFQPILLLDMCFAHLGSRLTDHASQRGLWLLPVPAGLTYLIQPLDTHCFGLYKRRWRRAYQRLRQAVGGAGTVSDLMWGRLLFDMARFLNTIVWRHAFEETGTLGSQTSLGPRLLNTLRPFTPEQISALPAGPPSIEALKAMFPANRRRDIVNYLRPVLQAAQARAALL